MVGPIIILDDANKPAAALKMGAMLRALLGAVRRQWRKKTNKPGPSRSPGVQELKNMCRGKDNDGGVDAEQNRYDTMWGPFDEESKDGMQL